MGTKKREIKKSNKKAKPATNKAKFFTVGTNAAASANVKVAAAGAIVVTGSNDMGTAITARTNANVVLHSAVLAENAKNKTGCEKFDSLVVVMMQEYPNAPDTWEGYGMDVTTGEIHDATTPGEVLHGSMSQGDFQGTADIHHDPLEAADDYLVFVTKGNPTLPDCIYIDVTNNDESTAKSNTTVRIPNDYLNVPLFFKLQAHNAAGLGPKSPPFGGRPIN